MFCALQVDKVYYISKGTLKPANKTFSNLPNDYEMTLNNDSVIQECVEDLSDIPTVKYDFVPINQIAEKPVNTIVGELESPITNQLLTFGTKLCYLLLIQCIGNNNEPIIIIE